MPEKFENLTFFHGVLGEQSFYNHNNEFCGAQMPVTTPYVASPETASMSSPMTALSSPEDMAFLNDNENSLLRLGEGGALTAEPMDEPKIIILDQPVEKFRFRYKSEMMGTHGSLASVNSTSRRKRQVPTVKVLNAIGKMIIRCSLVTKNEERRIPHAHHLVKREGNDESDTPYEVEVSEENDYTASFIGMGIIHTAKKHIKDELMKKMKAEKLEEIRRADPTKTALSMRDEVAIKLAAESAGKWMDLNSVALCFQAFIKNEWGVMEPKSAPVYSHPINNLKSALTGELKICRIDKNTSCCGGNEEIFLLVEKVGKKNIRIKFFELDDKDTEIWCDYGKFSELDVHHQYAIVFRTPPYKDRDITESKTVYIQLERPTDGDCSEAITFTYKPMNKLLQRKRPRLSCSEPYDFSNPIDSTIVMSDAFAQKNQVSSTTPSDISAEINKILTEKCPSDEFRNCVMSLNLEAYMSVADDRMAYESEYTTDGPKSTQSIDDPNFSVIALKQAVMEMKNESSLDSKLMTMLRERTSYGDTPLHSAIRHGQRDVVRYILALIAGYSQLKSLVNIESGSGKTPLHYAVMLNQPDIVRALLLLGADPNACDSHGSYALHEAVRKPENWECVDALINGKVDIERHDDAGWTALQLAAEAGSLKAVDLLVKAGGDVNKTEGSYGRTALHIAVEGGHIDVVRYLLEKTNVDVNKQNFGGNTALHTAKVNTGVLAQELCELLKKYGANSLITNRRISSHADTSESEIKQESESSDEESVDGQTFDLASCRITENNEVKVKEELIECEMENELEWLELDDITELGNILEENNGWKPLAERLGCHAYLSNSLESSGASPALTILTFAQVQGFTISTLLDLLINLKQLKAANFIKNVMNRSTST